ncbi:outer membrane beta-barrel protein [Bradyrhizobium sp. DOA9]|uniref:outer membrane beta-barrel protein n=1 Tax=Bradyrhizobium sp. DOA9 TaxID=1126627 RepID=UPI0004696579|nr:outer membrane beta-barrel protein [Bradyrhizobium sp. DOA9]GAJ37705.1 31 kDa outer-membrane immunogenic protein precursor [Bradyrhizobium sp. DOA9]
MKKLLLMTASIVALLSGPSAFAADLAAQPLCTKAPPAVIAVALYDWSGFYAGVNGGWGLSQNSWDFAGTNPEGSHDSSGGTVGGQLGYRWQIGQTVLGVEGQGNWADFRGSNVSAVFSNTDNRTSTEAFGLITGQIGYAINNVLLYAKGGAAIVSSRYEVNSIASGVRLGSADTTRFGGVVGAGFEVNLTPNWSAGLEYDHVFMPTSDVGFAAAGGGTLGNDRIHQELDLVTARLNYKFGWPLAFK